jgi:hypothetical protein
MAERNDFRARAHHLAQRHQVNVLLVEEHA